jgi:hypothetical protein
MTIPNLSAKEAQILQEISRSGEMYAGELVRRSNGELKRETTYSALLRMAGKDFVTSRRVKGKRLFRETQLGT